MLKVYNQIMINGTIILHRSASTLEYICVSKQDLTKHSRLSIRLIDHMKLSLFKNSHSSLAKRKKTNAEREEKERERKKKERKKSVLIVPVLPF